MTPNSRPATPGSRRRARSPIRKILPDRPLDGGFRSIRRRRFRRDVRSPGGISKARSVRESEGRWNSGLKRIRIGRGNAQSALLPIQSSVFGDIGDQIIAVGANGDSHNNSTVSDPQPWNAREKRAGSPRKREPSCSNKWCVPGGDESLHPVEP